MKIVKMYENQVIEIEEVETIDGLHNSVLIKLEPRDKEMKLKAKGARQAHSKHKNVYSVSSLNEAIRHNECKENSFINSIQLPAGIKKSETEISIEKSDKKLLVKISYGMKDAFKSVFTSAKWVPEVKKWQLSDRSEKKLIIWIDAIKRLAETIKVPDESGKSEEFENLKEIVAKLEKQEEIITKIEQDNLLKKSEIASQKVFIEKTVCRIVNIDDVKHAINAMKKNHYKTGTSAREAFYTAQKAVCEAVKQLAAIGLSSNGLDYAACANFNRYDRDNLNKMPDIFDVKELVGGREDES